MSDDQDGDVLKPNWQKLAAELDAAGQPDRRAPTDDGAEQATRRLKLVVKNAIEAAKGLPGKKRR